MSTTSLSRRKFMLAGIAGGVLALSGCSWTPRNAGSQQARPALATRIDDMSRYGTIYLGYPNWWASIPMPIATFLESYDFSGKEIRPFCSNGGGGLGQSVTAISKLVPSAHVGQGLSIYYSGGADMPQQVADWIAARA